ncbi:MAG: outer membrane beta-barrel protein [Gammaproteobacteria bacterium]|nr:outer membrane beta-barrel protein [Gammaproteobacteria bacterium]
MNKLTPISALLVASMATPAFADEPWTEVGVYIFATEISGDATLGSVTADVDMSFSDILDNLDIGFMAYIEHRRDEWSFIGDIAHLKIEDDDSGTVGRALEIGLEAELTQTVLEGFAGYRFLNKSYDSSDLGVDVLFGARHVALDIDITLDTALAGFSNTRSRSEEEDWIDYVVGIRLESDYRNGWGSMVWLDLGEGSDSSSYQALAMVNYATSDTWKFYGGYRLLNLEYETGSGSSKFGVDLDYSGPMGGVAYKF